MIVGICLLQSFISDVHPRRSLGERTTKKEKKCCPVMRVTIKTTPNKHFWEYLFEETGEK